LVEDEGSGEVGDIRQTKIEECLQKIMEEYLDREC